jgi:hypothetical protein
LAFGAKGVLYIADYGDHLVRKVLPDGTIQTAAGSGRSRWPVEGAPAARTAILDPSTIASDAAGNLYGVFDTPIWRVSPDGIIWTVAEDPMAAGALPPMPAETYTLLARTW